MSSSYMEIPLEEIASATNNFGDQNLIHKGAFVNVYKGKVLSGSGQLGNIIVQRKLDDRVYEPWEEIFWNDLLDVIGVLRELCVVGFSADKNIIVYDHLGNASLRQDLSDPAFDWMQRLKICLDLTRSAIPLNWKLTSGMVYCNSYFEMLYIISLGDLMFEVLCEKKGEPHVTPTAIEHYEKGELENIINPNLRLQIHQESLSIFSKTAYKCVKHPRVYIHEIRNQLEEVRRLPPLKLQPQLNENLEEFGVRIPHEEIVSATNNFADQNVLHSGNSVNVYKGKVLLQSGQLGNIVVRSEVKLWAMTSSARLHRPLSVVGFSSDKRIIVYEHVGNAILKKDVSDPTFNWMQRLRVCLNLANRWKSSTFMAPTNTYLEMVYVISLADLMFEVLCEKKEHPTTLRRAIEHYEKGRLEKIIHPHLSLQMHHQSLTVFSKTAYNCLQQSWIIDFDMDGFYSLEQQMYHEKDEPCIIDVVKEGLEKALELQMEHEKYLEHIKIELKDIRLSTNNFAKEYVVGKGTYGTVYKAELEYFDRKSSSIVRDIVAIKRISKRQDGLGDQGFFAELNMLSSCDHSNVISLLGFCHEKRILVYEYAFKQSLSEYLGDTKDKIILTWAKRLQICLDIAHGLDYLHNNTEHKPRIIHRDVKSDNILLGENWNAKIGDFGLSKFHPMNQQASTINTEVIAGTPFYLDPEYEKTGQLKKESDVYSFGVVLFEILSGRLAYDPIYLAKNNNGLPPIARQCFNKRTLKEIVDPQMKEPDELIPTVHYGPNPDSLYTFAKIAYRCLAETQSERPTIEEIVKELQTALNFQENRDDILLKLSFEDLNLVTENFNDNNCIVRGALWKAYSGKIQYRNKLKDIVAMRCRHEDDLSLKKKKEDEFLQELEFLMKHKHENIVDVLGYCKEENETIIIYDLASIGSLDMHLGNAIIGWVERLKICIDVASALEFLHEGVQVIHRDIRSASILLNGDWRAKISDFGLSFLAPIDKKMEDYDMNDVFSTPGYCDPSYWGMGFLTKESDIYSLGVVLFEILCGRSTTENYNHEGQFLDDSVKKLSEERRLDEIVFDVIKPQIVSHSLTTFLKIANQCLHHRRQKRPTAAEVVLQLKKALEFQMEPRSGGPGGERVLSSIAGKGHNIGVRCGDPHADRSGDSVGASHTRLDGIWTDLEPKEDVEKVECIRGSIEKELDRIQTTSEACSEEVGFDTTQDFKLSLMGLQTSCSTKEPNVVSQPLEVQELIEENEKLKYQLQVELARNLELVARVADLEARVAELEANI